MKNNKMTQKLMMLAILAIGLCFTCVNQTIAQRPNLALGKKTSHSSDIGTPFKAGEGVAALAVDGKTDGDWFKGSVTSTACNINSANECQGSYQPYWRVDLGAVYDIDEIQIWNRTDCCQERLSNFKIMVTSDVKRSQSTGNPREEFEMGFHNASDEKHKGKNPMTFRDRKRGRYVTITVLNKNAFISLAEVKVFGRLSMKFDTCKTTEQLKNDKASKEELFQQRACWLNKVKNGRKNLSKADLSGADMRRANLRKAVLLGANLNGANLDGADISWGVWSRGSFGLVIRVVDMVCTMSDDEGPGNDADMGSFGIKVNGKYLYSWSGGPVTTGKGYRWRVDRQVVIPFRGSYQSVNLWAKAVEMDDRASNETGENQASFKLEPAIVGKTVKRSFTIASSDFVYQINVEMKIIKSNDR